MKILVWLSVFIVCYTIYDYYHNQRIIESKKRQLDFIEKELQQREMTEEELYNKLLDVYRTK